jgi:photosystem II stability/assembly factor-like uncharacterized protein/Ca2+-binding EF-hand superfamily protein
MKRNFLVSVLALILLLSPLVTLWGQWERVQLPHDHPEVFALGVFEDTHLFIGTGGLPNSTTNAIGILWSDDHGANVTTRSQGLEDTRFDYLLRSLHSWAGIRLAGSGDGVYFSEDNGLNWEKRSDGLPVVTQTSKQSSNALASLGDRIFCGTPSGVFMTADAGHQWSDSSNGLDNPDVRAMASLDNLLFASTDGDGIYRSSDAGANWVAVNNGIPVGTHSRAMIAANHTIFAGTTSGTYRSTDQGNTWTATLPSANARSFAAGNGLIALGAFRGSGMVYLSSDNGDNWTDVSANLPTGGVGVWAMAMDSEYLYAAVNAQGLWRRSISNLLAQNKDGKTVPELGQARQTLPGNQLMAALDPNKDGSISSEEMNNAVSALKSLDKNQDGQLSPDEIATSVAPASNRAGGPGGIPGGRSGGPDIIANLKTMDVNHDGKVSRNEIPERMQRILDRADTNKDDALDTDEIEAFSKQLGQGGRN